MAFSPLEELSGNEIVAVCAGVGAFGGVLNYLHRVVEGRPFKAVEFLLYTATSVFCGVLTGGVLHSAEFPLEVICAVCGVAGWMGTGLLRLLEVVARKRLGITKGDLDE